MSIAGRFNLVAGLRSTAARVGRSTNQAPVQLTIGFIIALIGMGALYLIYQIFGHH